MISMKNDYPILAFREKSQLRSWFADNHESSDGIWLRIYKKNFNQKTVSYAEALDEALCFGWIDGLKKTYDSDSFLQKFTPRRTKSLWSKRNRDHIDRLIKEKKMTPSGLKEVEAAKKDGRWDAAYDSSSTMEVPADFLKELKKDQAAFKFFETLNRTNTYAIAWRLQTARKPETRAKRFAALLTMLKEGKKLH